MKNNVENPQPSSQENDPGLQQRKKNILAKLVEAYVKDMDKGAATAFTALLETAVEQTSIGIAKDESDEIILNRIKQDKTFFNDDLPNIDSDFLPKTIQSIRIFWLGDSYGLLAFLTFKD